MWVVMIAVLGAIVTWNLEVLLEHLRDDGDDGDDDESFVP